MADNRNVMSAIYQLFILSKIKTNKHKKHILNAELNINLNLQ